MKTSTRTHVHTCAYRAGNSLLPRRARGDAPDWKPVTCWLEPKHAAAVCRDPHRASTRACVSKRPLHYKTGKQADPMSVPIPNGTPQRAAMTASPLDDPPGVRAAASGLSVRPAASSEEMIIVMIVMRERQQTVDWVGALGRQHGLGQIACDNGNGSKRLDHL